MKCQCGGNAVLDRKNRIVKVYKCKNCKHEMLRWRRKQSNNKMMEVSAMGLSCGCFEWEPEPGEWVYWFGDTKLDFVKLDTSKRKRCCSCKNLIGIGRLCVKYPRYRYPHTEVEANIVGADWDFNEEPPIRMADHYHCERCGEIWLNLNAIGYECLQPNENMITALREYHEITGFKR